MTRKFWQKLSFAVIKPHNVISMKESPKLQKKRKESFRTILVFKKTLPTNPLPSETIKKKEKNRLERFLYLKKTLPTNPLPSETTKKRKESFRTILIFKKNVTHEPVAIRNYK